MKRAIHLGLAGIGLCATLFLYATQVNSGGTAAELGMYPDESAHYVTGLMVREYVLGGWWQQPNPIAFAERYYLHYPKVAFGHWPPLYYLVQVAWSFLAGSSINAWLSLQPILLGLLAAMLFAVLARRIHMAAAALFSLTFCLSPATLVINLQMMAEPLLAVVTFAALYYAAAYFAEGKTRSMVAFAVAACLAAYTKGSGLALFGLPLLLALVMNRRDVLQQKAFWLPQLVAWAVHLPWLILTLPMARNGMEDATVALVAAQALQLSALMPGQMMGWLLMTALGVSLVSVALRYRHEPLAVAAALTVFLVWIFHAVSPNGAEARRLYMAWPAMLLTIALCLRTWPAKWQAAAGACALASVAWVYAPVEKYVTGYRKAGWELRELVKSASQGILVSSQADGEGMLIAEVAQREPVPQAFLIRASKLIASSDWNGHDYRLRLAESTEIRRLLDSIPIRFAVLDDFSGRSSFSHHAAMREAITRSPKEWELRRTIAGREPYQGRPGRILIYERVGQQHGEVRNLEVSLHRMLGRSIALPADPNREPAQVRDVFTQQ